MKRIMLLFRLISAFLLALAFAYLLAACGGPQPQTTQTASYQVQLQLANTTLGNQQATIQISTRAGQPATVDNVVVSPLMETMGMASPETEAISLGGGRYQTDQVYFSMLGDWEVDVQITAGGTTETARFLVPVQQ